MLPDPRATAVGSQEEYRVCSNIAAQMAATDTQLLQRRDGRSLSWVPGILLGVFLAAALVGAVLWALTGMGLYELSRMFRGGQVHMGIDQPTVVRQVRALQRLETVSYTTDKIITGERENPILPDFLAGDRLLLVAHGNVIAGLDLAKLQPRDVEVHGSRVSIRLPESEIFTTRLDNLKTRVYSRDTGLFSSPDPNLESEVRAEAERQLQAAALEDGILRTAETNARQTINGMLSGLGFKNIELL